MSSPNDLLLSRIGPPLVRVRPNTGQRHVNSAPLAEQPVRPRKADVTIGPAHHCPLGNTMLVNSTNDSLTPALSGRRENRVRSRQADKNGAGRAAALDDATWTADWRS